MVGLRTSARVRCARLGRGRLALLALAIGACQPRGSSLSPARNATGWSDSVVAALSLRDRAAQLVWPWILGDYVPEGSEEWRRLQRLVSEDHVGGFILSVGSPLDIAAKANALQRLSRIPLLMSADMETGAGFRARGGVFVPNGIDLGGATVFPVQMAIGATRDTSLAYDVGYATAREARAIGIQIAFGPVLDVNNNPSNPVIGARSFSEDPILASRLGAATVRGLQAGGVVATGKHFPGHGDTETNSHLALSVVRANRARLDSVELVPFRSAIAAGAGAIMTFHGFLPALDSSGVPATLSKPVMTGLLRGELGFKGLLITDAMDMKGVVDRFGAVEATKRAIEAGNDVLLMPSDVEGTIDAIVAGVHEGRYSEERINTSVLRLLRLKERFGLDRERTVSLDAIRSIVGDSLHQRLADRVASRSIVLAKDSLSQVPLTRGPAQPRLLVINYARRADLTAGATFVPELRRAYPKTRASYVDADEQQPRLDAVYQTADSVDVVVVCSYVNINSESATATAPPALIEFLHTLTSRSGRVVLISFGSPYLLEQVPFVSTYMLGWGNSRASQRAAARALTGAAPITGLMPIAIPGHVRFGTGIPRVALSGNSAPPQD